MRMLSAAFINTGHPLSHTFKPYCRELLFPSANVWIMYRSLFCCSDSKPWTYCENGDIRFHKIIGTHPLYTMDTTLITIWIKICIIILCNLCFTKHYYFFSFRLILCVMSAAAAFIFHLSFFLPDTKWLCV